MSILFNFIFIFRYTDWDKAIIQLTSMNFNAKPLSEHGCYYLHHTYVHFLFTCRIKDVLHINENELFSPNLVTDASVNLLYMSRLFYYYKQCKKPECLKVLWTYTMSFNNSMYYYFTFLFNLTDFVGPVLFPLYIIWRKLLTIYLSQTRNSFF